MEKKECFRLPLQQEALQQCLSCPLVITYIPTRHLTKDLPLRTVWNWKEVSLYVVSFLTYVILIPVRRLLARISMFYLFCNAVFHFKFIRISVPKVTRVTMEWCNQITTWRPEHSHEITFLTKPRMCMHHLHSLHVDILKWLNYWKLFLLESVVTLVMTLWLCMTEGSRRSLHCAITRNTIGYINKSLILNNWHCRQCKHWILCRTNSVAAVCISFLKDPFLCGVFKIAVLLLMLRPSPTVCMAFNDDPHYLSYDSYQSGVSYPSPIPPFGVLPGYKYAFNTKLPDKVMTEGVIICLLAGTAFVGLVVWLAKTNFKESQQRRMRREASLRDRTLLVQTEDDIV